jgi:hypothetical protein
LIDAVIAADVVMPAVAVIATVSEVVPVTVGVAVGVTVVVLARVVDLVLVGVGVVWADGWPAWAWTTDAKLARKDKSDALGWPSVCRVI